MNRALRVFAVSLSLLVPLTGCKKKPQLSSSEVRAEQERSLPTTDQVTASQPSIAQAQAEENENASPEDSRSNADFEAWFKKHGLDLNDPNMLDADSDQDGFSNREEFLADTNPHDPNSRPGVAKNIRMKEYSEVNLPFVLRSVENGMATVEFTGAGEGQREKLKTGDTIRGTKLHVDRVSSRFDTDKHGERVDLSQMILTDPETQDRMVAVKDLPTRTNSTSATLTDPTGKLAMKVREGEVFVWPNEPESLYKVIDLRPEQIVVKDEKTGNTITIPRL